MILRLCEAVFFEVMKSSSAAGWAEQDTLGVKIICRLDFRRLISLTFDLARLCWLCGTIGCSPVYLPQLRHEQVMSRCHPLPRPVSTVRPPCPGALQFWPPRQVPSTSAPVRQVPSTPVPALSFRCQPLFGGCRWVTPWAVAGTLSISVPATFWWLPVGGTLSSGWHLGRWVAP